MNLKITVVYISQRIRSFDFFSSNLDPSYHIIAFEIIIKNNFVLCIYSVTTTLMMYMYFQGRNSEQAKLDSKYYQRFLAKKSDQH